MVRVPVRPGMRAMGGPPTKESWSGPITQTVDPSSMKMLKPKRRVFPELKQKDTSRVVVRDDESEGQRATTWHRSAFPENPTTTEPAPAAGLTRPRRPVSLSAPVSEAGPTKRYEGEDFPAGKPRFAYGDRHDLCGPGFTHDRVIRHEGEDQACSYETSEKRDAQKLYKATSRKIREASSGKHCPKPQPEPWDEAIAMKMKARQQEDEWRRCLKKRSGVPSQAARTQLTARSHLTNASAASMAPTSCSMVTAGFCNAEVDTRKHGNGVMTYGKLQVPLFPGDELAPVPEASIVSQSQAPDEDDYHSAIGMCRTDRLSRLLRLDGEKP